jgi:hypothetical protein
MAASLQETVVRRAKQQSNTEDLCADPVCSAMLMARCLIVNRVVSHAQPLMVLEQLVVEFAVRALAEQQAGFLLGHPVLL